jgi:hypothetical protein
MVVSDLPVHGMAVGVMRSDPVRETLYASDSVLGVRVTESGEEPH